MYLFNKGGQTFSKIDLIDNRRVSVVEIPANFAVVSELLKAIENGLRLRRKTNQINYDRTYSVPPRRLISDRDVAGRLNELDDVGI